MNSTSNNINIFFNEKDDVSNDNDDDYIKKMINMLNEFTEQDFQEFENNNQNLNKWTSPLIMLNDYTKPELLKICNYYGLDKYVKEHKLKKQDIINSIVYFESLPKNNDIVQKRYLMWENIYELLNDPKMKKYIMWI
jgi:hypothetical protein